MTATRDTLLHVLAAAQLEAERRREELDKALPSAKRWAARGAELSAQGDYAGAIQAHTASKTTATYALQLLMFDIVARGCIEGLARWQESGTGPEHVAYYFIDHSRQWFITDDETAFIKEEGGDPLFALY